MYTVLKVEMASYKKKNNQEIDKMITGINTAMQNEKKDDLI